MTLRKYKEQLKVGVCLYHQILAHISLENRGKMLPLDNIQCYP